LTQAGEEKRLQLSELEDIRVEAYGLSCFMINIFLGNNLPEE